MQPFNGRRSEIVSEFLSDEMMCCSMSHSSIRVVLHELCSSPVNLRHTELVVVHQPQIASLHRDFMFMAVMLICFLLPSHPVFDMYLSSHPDAPTTTPKPTTAIITTTSTTITTSTPNPEASQVFSVFSQRLLQICCKTDATGDPSCPQPPASITAL
ncbi:hypothetical protein ATANTOWER_002569 [Ataeniobius toweri]|uniref:Uncharacterized protein n=1 Tax=Ataeniobius toweri TaxID=208326 RepID=A0ABU7B6X2_9TELE|nr:hypothetical protein [Ataeniobius toweri]